MTESATDESEDQEARKMTMAEFLERMPPNQDAEISDIAKYIKRFGDGTFADSLHLPELQLHCTNESCNGLRFFRYIGDSIWFAKADTYEEHFVKYRCANCRKTMKMFSITVQLNVPRKPEGAAYKYGEFPVFGPPTPARLIKLIGPDRDEFLQGRRCENQGLGVGAFGYYRRVVENQKDRILGEIVKVAKRLESPQSTIDALESAIVETQFSKALEIAKAALPQSLMINGRNPLLLLHNALSDGLHRRSDEECLALA